MHKSHLDYLSFGLIISQNLESKMIRGYNKFNKSSAHSLRALFAFGHSKQDLSALYLNCIKHYFSNLLPILVLIPWKSVLRWWNCWKKLVDTVVYDYEAQVRYLDCASPLEDSGYTTSIRRPTSNDVLSSFHPSNVLEPSVYHPESPDIGDLCFQASLSGLFLPT